ncbi:MAG: polyprenyl synthetase family protein [Actinomycetota bacterium]
MRDLRDIEKEVRRETLEHGASEVKDQKILKDGRYLRVLLLLLTASFGSYEIETLKPIGVALELLTLGTKKHYPLPVSNQALITADYYYARALTIVAGLGNSALIRILSQALMDVAEGQMMAVSFAGPLDVVLKDYYYGLRKRCAFYRAAAEIGGLISGVDEEVSFALKEFGERFGVAYEARSEISLPDIFGHFKEKVEDRTRREVKILAAHARKTLANLPPSSAAKHFEELADAMVQ